MLDRSPAVGGESAGHGLVGDAGAGFVARAFTGRKDHLVNVMKQAIEHDGYALVDILQPCVSFNHVNTFAYYDKRVHALDADYDAGDKLAAMAKAMEFGDTIPIGVIYREQRQTFHRRNEVLRDGTPLLDRKTDPATVQRFIKEFI